MLELKTIFIYTAMINLSIVSVVTIAWLRNPRQKDLVLWCMAALCAVLSGVLMSKFKLISVDYVEFFGGALLISMTGFIWLGFKDFFRCSYHPIEAFAVTAAAAILMVLAGFLPDPEGVRGMLIYGGSAVNLLLAANVVWVSPSSEHLPSRRLAALVLGAYALTNILIAPMSIVAPVELVVNTPVSAWLGPASILLAIFNMACFLVIVVLKLERTSERQRQLAERDALTGVLNRRMFFTLGETLARTGNGAVAIFDLDYFKRINDTFGHKGGDDALIDVTKVIEANLPSGALLGRLGGEEFGLCLPGHDRREAAAVLERARAAIEKLEVQSAENRFSLTISCGYVMMNTSPVRTLDAWVNDADRALYAAKNEGRNRVILHHVTEAASPFEGISPPKPSPA